MARLGKESENLRKLRSQWGIFCGAAIVIILVSGWLTRHDTFSTPWLFLATFSLLYQAIILYFDLGLNRAKKSGKLLPGFGLGTWLSLVRLLLFSLLAGFLVTPRYGNWLAWAPFTLYLVFNLLDLVDGYAARRWGQVTRLGQNLDLDLDGRGMLVGSLMVVLIGTAGWWYLLVGLARYLFIFGIWARRKLRLPVIEKPNQLARPLAGLQMGVSTALLAPILHPPFTILISSLVMIPFLANFLKDWFEIGRENIANQIRFPQWVMRSLPTLLRLILFGLVFVNISDHGIYQGAELILAIAILLGVGVRTMGLLLLIQIGLALQTQDPDVVDLTISLLSLSLVYLGPGPFSFWQPETLILNRRLGEAEPK
jgi:CDP-diacylglycerol--glycerol-3-phosphate 3-phosphatidyltransferase